MNLMKIWEYAYSYVKAEGVNLDYWRDLPNPADIVDEFFFAELAWCIYNAEMKEALIRQKWPALSEAFGYFDPGYVVLNKPVVIEQALRIFNHRGKANAVAEGAEKILFDGPMGKKLGQMTEDEALTYLETYPFIGKVTKYHLARNMGFDVVKPDRHLVRITKFLGYESPDKLVQEIADNTGERKGFIDYILWQWLALQGPEAYKMIG